MTGSTWLRRVIDVVIYVVALIIGVLIVPSWPLWGRALYLGIFVGLLIGSTTTRYWHDRDGH